MRIFGRPDSLSGGGGSWGDIDGTLSDQADLQAALDAKQPTIGTSTWAARGSGSAVNELKWITDVGPPGGALFKWSTTPTDHWHLVAPCDLISDHTEVVGALNTDEQIGKQVVMPVGLPRAFRTFDVSGAFAKNGTTDAVTSNQFRIGGAGTIADSVLYGPTGMIAGNRSISSSVVFHFPNTTTVRVASGQNMTSQSAWVHAGTAQAYPKDITVADYDANPLYISMCMKMAGSTNASQMTSFIVTMYP